MAFALRIMNILLDSQTLKNSSTVANSLMNRERNCVGGNSYAKELSFNPLDFLKERLKTQEQITWLDLCCGTGRALIEAAQHLASENAGPQLKIIGVDLVPMFDSYSPELKFLQLIESSVVDWTPSHSFDLITCVHGLHYIGDKLHLVQKSCEWLKPDGIFLAHLDLNNFKFEDGQIAGKTIARELKKRGLEYEAKKHLLICRGKKVFNLNYTFIGADDKAGPNYTGQAAVDSYYCLG